MKNKMKNIYNINEFLKIKKSDNLNEATDRFANDISFSESLVGRLFNNIFGFFRKSIYTGMLVYYKRKLEDAYLEGVVKALSKIRVSEVSGDSDAALAEAAKQKLEEEENNTLEDVVQEKPKEDTTSAQKEEYKPVTAEEAVNIIKAIQQEHDARTETHMEILKYIDSGYPKKAAFDQFVKLKIYLQYAGKEIVEVQNAFTSQIFSAGWPKYSELVESDVNKYYTHMQTSVKSETAAFQSRYKNEPDVKENVLKVMYDATNEWKDLATIIVKGNLKIKNSDPAYQTLTANVQDKNYLGNNKFYVSARNLNDIQTNQEPNSDQNISVQAFPKTMNIQGLPNGFDKGLGGANYQLSNI